MSKFKTGRAAEVRKRALKRSEGLIEKGIDVPSDLLDGLPPKISSQLQDILESRITYRDVMSAAIASHLAKTVRTLHKLGFRNTPKGNQRPRKLDLLAWKALEAAESVTGIAKVVMLKACLSQLAERGVTRVDLQACLDEIARMGP